MVFGEPVVGAPDRPQHLPGGAPGGGVVADPPALLEVDAERKADEEADDRDEEETDDTEPDN